MKFIGFIKEQDEYFFGKSLKKYYLLDIEENIHRKEVIEYLKRGELCVAFMGIAEDEDDERMGLISVYTDGIWVWPDYFKGYLNKYPNFKIEDEFVKYILKNKGKKIELSKKELSKLENNFCKIAGFK